MTFWALFILSVGFGCLLPASAAPTIPFLIELKEVWVPKILELKYNILENVIRKRIHNRVADSTIANPPLTVTPSTTLSNWPKATTENISTTTITSHVLNKKEIQDENKLNPPDPISPAQNLNPGENQDEDVGSKAKQRYLSVFAYDNFGGASNKFTVSRECYTLPDSWQKRISSVNTHAECVEVCPYSDCSGSCMQIAPGTLGHNRLRHINFDKRIISIRAC